MAADRLRVGPAAWSIPRAIFAVIHADFLCFLPLDSEGKSGGTCLC